MSAFNGLELELWLVVKEVESAVETGLVRAGRLRHIIPAGEAGSGPRL